MPADLATLTAEQIIGADIHDANGQVIASVDDLVLGPDGKAESVAAKFGGFLGFGSKTVVLTLDEVEFMQNDSGQVTLRTDLTPEALEGRSGLPEGLTRCWPVGPDRRAPARRSFSCRPPAYGRPPEAPDVQIIPTDSIPLPHRFHIATFPAFSALA